MDLFHLWFYMGLSHLWFYMVLSHLWFISFMGLYDGVLIYHFICDRVNPNSEMNRELRN